MSKDYLPSFIAILWALKFVAALNPSCIGRDLYRPFRNEDDPDSASYFVCTNRVSSATKVECPDELIFNAETRSCSLPGYVVENKQTLCRVENQLVDNPETESGCSEYSTCNSALKPEGQVACDNGKLFNPHLSECVEDIKCNKDKRPDCREAIFNGKQMLIEDDDAAYYICQDGIRLKKKCPSNNIFDPAQHKCVMRTKTVSKPLKLFDINSICKGYARKYIPDPLYCKGYYFCINDDTPYWNYCDEIPHLYFNNGFCVSSRPSTCSCEDLQYPDDTDQMYVKHESKNKYYICEKNNIPVSMSCPRGYIFYENDESCIQI